MDKKSLFYYKENPVVSIVIIVDGYAEFKEEDGRIVARFPVPIDAWFRIDKDGVTVDWDSQTPKVTGEE